MTRRWGWSWVWAARLRERWRRRRRLRDRIGDRLVRFLTAPLSRYERPALNDLDALKRHIRKGDVLLSQGNQRISAIIQYLTQSSWSHSSLYVGDEILQRGGELAERMRTEYGDEAAYLLIEALPEGVSLMPLSHYADFHIRLCRPHRIRPDDLKIILDRAIGAIGWRYDLRNIVDLALYYLPAELVPGRFRPKAARGLGSRAPESVICTRLIGELFGQVGFPVLPQVTLPDDAPAGAGLGSRRPPLLKRVFGRRERYPGLFRRRHPSYLAPRDFDISPYFEIVKFNVIADGDFDSQRIHWVEDETGPDPEVEAESAEPGDPAETEAGAKD
ncbi:MAG: lipo-like protein [Proteobacteria bacterium]|nr:lipo-like protein [Pseudomonadota bacterium]